MIDFTILNHFTLIIYMQEELSKNVYLFKKNINNINGTCRVNKSVHLKKQFYNTNIPHGQVSLKILQQILVNIRHLGVISVPVSSGEEPVWRVGMRVWTLMKPPARTKKKQRKKR